MKSTMQAVVLTGHGGFDRLEFHGDWPRPEPGPGEALIRVAACGLNNTDVNIRTGWYSRSVDSGTTGDSLESASEDDAGWGGEAFSFPRIQGADVAGRVEAVGEGADAGLVGKRVMVDPWLRDWADPLNLERCRYFGSECDGGFAQFTVAPQGNVHAVDTSMSDAELATFATSSMTAENMLERARVGEADVVLIPGASGGVGSALIQLARRRGAVTVALCGDDKAKAVSEIGADAVLPRAPDDLRDALRDALGRDTVTVVADVVGGAQWPQFIDVLARRGRYTCAGAIAGPEVSLDLRIMYLRDLTFTGATVTAPDTFANLVGYIQRDEIRPLLAGCWPLSQLVEAQRAFIDKRHVGNLVVECAV